jgi:hypothetical protein
MIVVAREDAEVHLQASQTMTEHFLQCECGHCRREKTASFFGNNVWNMGCS